MSELKWTRKQLDAINTKGDVIVSASAGSGKTTVMIERVIRLINEGAHIKNMLLCTFTVSSAEDMRAKLHKRLYKLSSETNNQNLTDNCNYLPQADICTLHSWCKRINAEYFFASNIDPSATLLDETDAYALKLQSINEVIGRYLEQNLEDFNCLYDSMRIRGGNLLEEIILDICDFAASLKNPFEFLFNCHNMLDKAKADEFYKNYINDSKVRLQFHCEKLLNDIIAQNAQKLIGAVNVLSAVLNGGAQKFLSLPKGSMDEFPELVNRYKLIKNKINELEDCRCEFLQSLESDCEVQTKILADCAKNAYELYQEKKLSQSVYDYEDMMHATLRVLQNELCRQSIIGQYKYIFVDEYQDINPLQHAIIMAFKGHSDIFLVGDVKQSIYAFRHCDPSFFIKQYCEGDFTPIELNSNFRSGKTVLDFVNDVFCNCMSQKVGGTDYKNQAMLIHCREDISSKVSFENISGQEPEAALPDIYSVMNAAASHHLDKTQAQINVIIKKVFKLLQSGAKQSEIAILTRNKNIHQRLLKSLNTYKINAAIMGETKIADLPELKMLLQILKLLSNRNDDIALAMVLKGAFCALDEQQLLDIRNFSSNEPFYEAAQIYAQNGDDLQIRQRLNDFFDKLNYYKRLSYTLKVDELLGIIISQNHYFEYLFSFGTQKAENLNLFLMQLSSLNANASLESFLEYLQSSNAVLKHGFCGDAVNIMTIHASKGLEFPHVILADCLARFNESDTKKRVIISSEFGLCLKNYDKQQRQFFPSYKFLAAKQQLSLKNFEQELRILYVALTRAQKTLDILFCGDLKDKCLDVLDCKDFAQIIALCFAPSYCYDINSCRLPEPSKEQKVFSKYNQSLYQKIKQRIEFGDTFEHLPVKTVVTAVAARTDDDESVDFDYAYSGLDRERAALKGIAYHYVMEHIDFEDFESSYQSIAIKNPDVLKFVDKTKIKNAADKIKNLIGEKKYYTEQPFIIDAKRSDLKLEGEGNILVQGIIDLIITDGTDAVIVDYKTSKAHTLLSEPIKKQLAIYVYSVKHILKLNIKDCLIYSFDSDDFVKLDVL